MPPPRTVIFAPVKALLIVKALVVEADYRGVTTAAPDQESTPKRVRAPARYLRPARPGAGPVAARAEEAVDDPGIGFEQSEAQGPDPGAAIDGPEESKDEAGGGMGRIGELEAERVVLAIGSTYFHDGRVGPERYASDLAPTFVGAVAASHTLLRELFKEMGADEGASIQALCDRWHLRYGAEVGQAQFSVDEEIPVDGAGARTTSGTGTGADGWVRGLVASRDSDHAQALAAFETEAAEAAEAGAPQRAAIAYRAAAAAALSAGRGDHANRLQRLAGKAYMEIAEKSETLPQGVFMAYRESARCFLEAGNLPLAHKCLSKAIAIGETLGYTEST